MNVFPERCPRCFAVLPEFLDPNAIVHQVVDLCDGNSRRWVTEYRAHSVRCTCGDRVEAALEKLPTSSQFIDGSLSLVSWDRT